MRAPHRPGPGQPGGSAGEPIRPRRTAVLAVTAGGLLLADLISKILVVAELQGRSPVKLPGHVLWLTHARNPGAAFSFAEGATVLFTAVAAIVVVVIIRTATRLRSAAWAVSLGLVLGGAAGNLVDRLFRSPGPLRGHVVDWISLRTPDGRMLFPIFNLADSGIVCGGILAVVLALLGYEMDGTRSTSEPTPPAPGPPPPGNAPPGAGPWGGPPGGPGGPPPPGPGPARPGPGPDPAVRSAAPRAPGPADSAGPWTGGPGVRSAAPRAPGPADSAGPWTGGPAVRPGGTGAGEPYVPSAGPLPGPGPRSPGAHRPGGGP